MNKTRSAQRAPLVTTSAFYAAAVAAGLPVALWRQPGAAEPAALASLRAPHHVAQLDFRRAESGFVLAPFSDDAPTLLLPADVRLQGGRVEFAPGHEPDAARLRALLDQGDRLPPAWVPGGPNADRALGEAEFTDLVAQAVAFIRARRIAKVVVSRTASVDLPPGFDPAALFETLCRRYPEAFVSLVSVPGVGTWIGASPELLLALEGARLSTMALAGTQRRPDASLEEVRWGAKEQVEQQMVSEYIRTVFAEAGVLPVLERGPRTVAAGSVVHLQTLFETDPAHPVSMEGANAVLERLHPTSAVCGMPRPQALQFIEEREGYDRGFYSGYLGPLFCEGRSTLYVNLRCMQLRERTASLYMGAGVTADSIPAAEWTETAMKARTILDALAEASAPASASAPALAQPLSAA